MLKKLLIAVVAMVLFSQVILAENLPTSNILSFTQLLKITSQNNLSIQMAQQKVKVAEAQLAQAWSAVFPKITLEAGANRLDGPQTRLAGIGMADYYSAKAGVNQLVFNGSVGPAIVASDYLLKGANAELQTSKEEVFFNVIKIYLTLIQLKEQKQVLQDSLDSLNKLLNKVQQMQISGLVTKTDVLRTKSGISAMKVGMINLQNTIDILRSNLNMLVNSDVGSLVIDEADIDKLYNTVTYNPVLKCSDILENRGDYRQLDNTASLLKTAVDINSGAWFPTIVIVANSGYSGMNNGFNFSDNDREWMYGINGSWSFFDFGQTGAKIDEAKANYKRMEQQLEQFKLAIDTELYNISLNISANKEKVKSLQEEEQVDIETYNLVNARYTVGEVTHLELIDAQNTLADVRSRLVSARIDVVLELLKWLKATGKLNEFINKGV